jgi:hypothetical protein
VPRIGERTCADIDGVDAKPLRRHAGVDQRHRHRIGFLPRRAGQTQQAELGGRTGGSLLQKNAGHGGEGLRIAEEPGLGNHDRFDQLLYLVERPPELRPIILDRIEPERAQPAANRPFDRGRADGIGMKPHRAAEQFLDALHRHHPSASSARSARRSPMGSRSGSSIR